MAPDTRFQHEINQLHSRYGEEYDRADAQLRKRPVLLAALYLKDAIRVSISCFGNAALCVPVAYFWGAMYDFGAVQKALAVPVESAALWSHVESLFTLVFFLTLGVAVLRGEFGRARSERLHAEAQMLFTRATVLAGGSDTAADRPACPHGEVQNQPPG